MTRRHVTSRDGMPDPPDYLPTASLQVLKLRADMLRWLREFFRDHGYWEVQTPLLSHDVCVDAWLEPFRVPLPAAEKSPQQCAFLQTSPEFAMKRLLAAGAGAIFQITSAFRRGESGPLHNPEFTIVEWYRVGDCVHDQMAFTEQLAAGFVTATRARREGPSSPPLPAPFPRMTYDAAFREACGQSVLDATTATLRQLASAHGVAAPASLAPDDRDGWLNLLLAEVVEPWIARRPALFVHDYPASQAALARIRQDSPPVAERFELYLQGIEICNGYHELTDPDDLRRRIAIHARLRQDSGRPPLPADSRLLWAMEAGLPGCSGVALGFDRLLMVAAGLTSIADVIAFPFDRA